MTTELSPKFDEALTYAAGLHATQTRKGTTIPYVSHLLAVASLVMENGGSEEEAIGALLHDSIEDQAEANGGADALREEIRERFGDEVLAIVEGCTDAETQPKPPWRERKEAYIAHLATAPASVLLVSCADKLHNARAILTDYREIGGDLWDRFNAGQRGVLWYYRGLANTFRASGTPQGLADELERTVSEIERLTDDQAA